MSNAQTHNCLFAVLVTHSLWYLGMSMRSNDAQHLNLRGGEGDEFAVSNERLQAFMNHPKANDPVHILVYRKYYYPTCLSSMTTPYDDADKDFDLTVSQVLASVGGAIVARTKAIMPNVAVGPEMLTSLTGWYVSMYGLPNRSAYKRFLSSTDYKKAREKLGCFKTDVESIAIANWVDYRVDPKVDCAWRPWGFDKTTPYPFPTTAMHDYVYSLFHDDGTPLQVWNVDQYLPGSADKYGGDPTYTKGAIKASWLMGMIHQPRSMCPGNVCDTQPLEGHLLTGINSVIIMEYPSVRTFLRMITDKEWVQVSYLKHFSFAENPFVKNADVPALVVQDEIPVTVPSPFATPETPSIATDCKDPAFISARKAEAATSADGTECDIEAMDEHVERCTRAVRQGNCVDAEGKSCAEWMLGPGSVCTQAVNYTMPETAPEGFLTGLFTVGLKNLAKSNGAWNKCTR